MGQYGQSVLFQRIQSFEPQFRHTFVRNNQRFDISPTLIDFMSGLLDKSPETRLGDYTALTHEFLAPINMNKLKRREIKSYIHVEPFNRNKMSKYFQKERPNHLESSQKSSVQEENLVGFSYAAQPDDQFN